MLLISIESSFHPCEFTAIVPGAYPGEAKMWLRLIAETDAHSVGDSHPSFRFMVTLAACDMIDYNRLKVLQFICKFS